MSIASEISQIGTRKLTFKNKFFEIKNKTLSDLLELKYVPQEIPWLAQMKTVMHQSFTL